MDARRKSEEIFNLIFEVLTIDPQSVGKIAKKTGLNWRTVNEYVVMIKKIQSKKKVRVSNDPTQIWYVEE